MKHRWLKRLAYILGIVFLGAIGSGLWSEFMSPIWASLSEVTIRSFASLSETFKNSIYSEAAKGFYEKPSLMLFAMVAGFFSGAAFYFVCFGFSPLQRVIGSNAKLLLFRFRRLIASVFLVMIVMLLFMSFHLAYVNGVAVFAINSIEIISPFIGGQRTLELRSQFAAIKTHEDYRLFFAVMRSLQDDYEIELPLREPL